MLIRRARSNEFPASTDGALRSHHRAMDGQEARTAEPKQLQQPEPLADQCADASHPARMKTMSASMPTSTIKPTWVCCRPWRTRKAFCAPIAVIDQPRRWHRLRLSRGVGQQHSVARQINLGQAEQAGYEVGHGAGSGTGPVLELTDLVGQ